MGDASSGRVVREPPRSTGEGGKVPAGAILGPLPAGWLYKGLNFSGSMSSTLSRTRW